MKNITQKEANLHSVEQHQP